MKLLPILTVGAVALSLWSLVSTAPSPRPGSRPSVVLITVDTLRPDRLGCYGHASNRTPAIDRLAREGTLFEVAYCDIPWTTGSMASVMTSMYSRRHGLQLPVHTLQGKAVTLPEVLSAAGYRTAAIIGSFPLDSVYGLDQGFDVYDDEFTLPIFAVPGKTIERVESYLDPDLAKQREFLSKKLVNDSYREDKDVTNTAIRWLTRNRGTQPFFLWVHYFGPHEKVRWDVPIPEQEQAFVNAYDGDVEIVDREVGRLLNNLDAQIPPASLLVVLHSDHGQSLGERAYVGHGLSLHDASTRIPMIMRHPPTFPPGTRSRAMARNIDILPTILEVAGLDTTGPWTGRSLVPTPLGKPATAAEVYLETYVPTMVPTVTRDAELGTVVGPVSMQAYRTSDWKLLRERVVGPCAKGSRPARMRTGQHYLEDAVDVPEDRCRQIERIELYRASDPEDPRFNVASRYPEMVRQLEGALDDTAQGRGTMRADLALSPEQERKLRSLGYLQ